MDLLGLGIGERRQDLGQWVPVLLDGVRLAAGDSLGGLDHLGVGHLVLTSRAGRKRTPVLAITVAIENKTYKYCPYEIGQYPFR